MTLENTDQMNKRLLLAALVLLPIVGLAQTTSEEFAAKYERLASKLGPSGVGIETLLDKWAQLDSADAGLLVARFNLYFEKSRSYEVQVKPGNRYLGAEPILSLKDSLGNKVNYFQVPVYDDGIFGKALRNIDKAEKLYPERLDIRKSKATALLAYEKENPLLTVECLEAMISEYGLRKWVCPGIENIDKAFFCSSIQEYCVAFFSIASPDAMEAMKTISEKMLSLDKNNPDFLVDLGSYYMSNKEYKKSLKYFDKALKVAPDNYPAIRNCCVYATKVKDPKLLKKYLPMMIEYGPENEAASAKVRLEAL